MEPVEIGIIMKVYLSDGELREVKRIAGKSLITERELDFIIAMAGRTTRLPKAPVSPGIEVLIRSDGFNFSIVNVNRNEHLNN